MAVELTGVPYYSDGRMFLSHMVLSQAAFRSASKEVNDMKG
jgi:hypothetical protein